MYIFLYCAVLCFPLQVFVSEIHFHCLAYLFLNQHSSTCSFKHSNVDCSSMCFSLLTCVDKSIILLVLLSDAKLSIDSLENWERDCFGRLFLSVCSVLLRVAILSMGFHAESTTSLGEQYSRLAVANYPHSPVTQQSQNSEQFSIRVKQRCYKCLFLLFRILIANYFTRK